MLQFNASLQLGNGYSPINGVLDFASSTTNGLLNLAGQTTSGLLNLAGQTVNGSLGLLSNALGGNGNQYGLSTGQGGYVIVSPQYNQPQPMTMHSSGNLLGNISDVLGRYQEQSYLHKARMYNLYNSSWYGGWRRGPYGLGMCELFTTDRFINPYGQYGGYGNGMYGCRCNGMAGANFPPDTKFRRLEDILNPKANGNNGQDRASDRSSEKPPIEMSDENGLIRTPSWYQEIADKVERNQPLTANEKKLKSAQEKLVKNYCPYRYNKDGQIMMNKDGKPILSPLGAEIANIMLQLEKGHIKQIEAQFRNMPKEKLAALEVWFEQMNGKPLRAAIKDASLTFFGISFGWTGINTSSAERIFDILDEVATTNPQNMALAMRQALQNHRMFGLGVDDDRVAKLLRKAAGNKEYLDAMNKEYGGTLAGDIDDKWFVSDENQQTVDRFLS